MCDAAGAVRYLTLPISSELAGSEVYTLLRRHLGLSGTVLRRVKWLSDGITVDGARVNVRFRVAAGQVLSVRLSDPDRPLVPAAFGILEPPADAPLLPRADIGLALVPAVCYDRRGFRLGFGGGYYDRWLSGFSGVTVGLCRDCVLQEHVPIEDHDRRVEFLLTESRRFSL